MHFTSLIPFLAPILTCTLANPVVRVHNTKPYGTCLKVQNSEGYGWFPITTTCHGHPGIWINAMATAIFNPPARWNGAISDFTGAGGDGTRLEINFSEPPKTWYNADMEFGISSATLGPTDRRRRNDGRDSLVGEADPLAKANAAWPSLKDKIWDQQKYITTSKDGKRLVNVYMDKQAPGKVQEFFQVSAGFSAYINHGSVAGAQSSRLQKAADEHSGKVDGTQDMTITIY
ncbi:MAG: hypothetical protein Q9169_002832 [Polycauliona sp. 2 TL-2023]